MGGQEFGGGREREEGRGGRREEEDEDEDEEERDDDAGENKGRGPERDGFNVQIFCDICNRKQTSTQKAGRDGSSRILIRATVM